MDFVVIMYDLLSFLPIETKEANKKFPDLGLCFMDSIVEGINHPVKETAGYRIETKYKIGSK